jgi:hypothetical protein
MVQTAAVVGSAAALGGGIAQMTGNEQLAEKFGYVTLGAGAVGLVGAAGVLVEAVDDYLSTPSPKDADKTVATGDAAGAEKEVVVDTRTDFEKMNDNFKTVNGIIGVGNQVVGTTGAVKGAVDTYNQQMDAAEALESQAVAQKEADDKQIAESEANAGGQAAGEAAGAGGFVGNRGPSGKPATTAQIDEARKVIDQMTAVDAKVNTIRAQLSKEEQDRFDEYLAMIAVAKNHMANRAAQSIAPDQQIIEDMIVAYEKVEIVVMREERALLAMSPERGSRYTGAQIDTSNSTRMLSLRPRIIQAERNFTFALAKQIRTHGEDKFAQRLSENFNSQKHMGRLSVLKNSLDEIQKSDVIGKFGLRDGKTIWSSIEKARLAVSEIDASASLGEFKSEDYLDKAQAAIDDAQRIIDRKLQMPARGSSLRAKREQNQYLADRALIQKTHQRLQEKSRKAQQVFHLARVAEEKITDRPVMAKNWSEERQFAKAAREAARMIEEFREDELHEDDPQYERLKRAEEIYSRVRFTTARETFEKLKEHYQEKSRRYVELKMKVAKAVEAERRREAVN